MAGYRKLGRPTDHRKAMLRNLVTSLFMSEDGKIITTETRAKETKNLAEKMITLAKRGDLHARRQVASFLYKSEVNTEDGSKDVVGKLFSDIAPKYSERNGGYTRILKMGPRRGDSAEMVILELV